MSMVKANNYVTIQGWMVSELGLSGNDLMVYAIIYGFSQAKGHKFEGSLQYLADWCNATKQGILKNLKNLVNMGLLIKEEEYVNHVKFVSYYATEFNGQTNKVEYPTQQSCTGGMQQSCINNIDTKNIEHTKEDNKDTYVNKFTEAYSNTCISLPKIRTLTDKRKKAILKLFKKYSEDDIMLVLRKVEESDFLAGRAKDWKADLDWILNENNFVKILEGKYDNHKASYNKKFAEYDVKSEQVTKEEIANGYFTGQVY